MEAEAILTSPIRPTGHDLSSPRWEFLGTLSQGGTGSIEAVRYHLAGDRVLAMKLLHPHFQGMPEMEGMLFREAELCAAFEHPNIPPSLEFGRLENGQPYFTMRQICGETLEQILLREHPLLRPASPDPDSNATSLSGIGLSRWLAIIDQVCCALDYAHTLGVIHCDVKAQNIMVVQEDHTYLLDWGVARVRPELAKSPVSMPAFEGSFTEDGMPRGTATCMAPEQARSEKVDGRTDVFAVGALLYMILCGKEPFRRGSLAASLMAAADGDCPTIYEAMGLVPGVDGVLSRLLQIVDRAMKFDPDDRFANMQELRRELAFVLPSLDTELAA